MGRWCSWLTLVLRGVMHVVNLSKCVLRIAGLVVLLVLFGIRGQAQSTFGSVRGMVQDESGAALPDAQVTLHSEGENNDRAVKRMRGAGSRLRM